MYNVGIIGLGHVATHQIAAIEESSDFRLLAGCDPDTSRHKVLDRSVTAYARVEELLGHSDLDVVVIASPNRLHVEHGLQVLAADKWLFMEKPLAETREEFDLFAEKKQELSGNCTLALHAAFGLEMEWFCRHKDDHKARVCDMNTFAAEFYDPYVEDGHPLPRAASLGGSWMDSGINALSVVCRLIDAQDLVMCSSQMTRDEDTDCLELEGRVDFEFTRPVVSGKGVISTSWITGRDKKLTTLGFESSGRTIVLDHSEQRVILREDKKDHLLYACNNDMSRLTNHYIGAFKDLAKQMKTGKDNFEYCQQLHRLLYQAESWPG